MGLSFTPSRSGTTDILPEAHTPILMFVFVSYLAFSPCCSYPRTKSGLSVYFQCWWPWVKADCCTGLSSEANCHHLHRSPAGPAYPDPHSWACWLFVGRVDAPPDGHKNRSGGVCMRSEMQEWIGSLPASNACFGTMTPN